MNFRHLVVVAILAFSTSASAGLSSVPVSTAGFGDFTVSGSLGNNVVSGSAHVESGNLHYLGQVTSPTGNRTVSIYAKAIRSKAVDTTHWLITNISAVVTINGITYPADLKVGDIATTTFEQALSELVEVYSRGPASRFTGNGNVLPAVTGVLSGPVRVAYTNNQGDRFAGTLTLTGFVQESATLEMAGTWTAGSRVLHVTASGFVEDRTYDDEFVEDRTYDDEFVSRIEIEMTRSDGSLVDRILPPTMRLHGTTVDDVATRFVHFALVMSASTSW